MSVFPYMQAPVEAVNFGGGTPTSLSPAQMAAVLSALHTHFRIAPDAEISVETSATELTDAMLDSLVSGGVNRLSVGIQTFDDGEMCIRDRYNNYARVLGLRERRDFLSQRVSCS